MATTSIRSRQHSERWASQVPTAVESRPSTMPRTCPSGQVDQGRHPWLEPSPGTVVGAEPAHRPVAVLIDAQVRHRHLVNGRQGHGGSRQRGLDQPPRDAMGLSDFRGRPARGDHRRDDLIAQPGGRACVSGDLVGCFPERAPGAGRLEAEPAPLGPHHLNRPGHGNVSHLLRAAGVDLRRDHPARRAPRVGRSRRSPLDALRRTGRSRQRRGSWAG